MKKRVDITRIKLYLWIGLSFLLLGFFFDLAEHTETFLPRAANDIWRDIYITVINYFLFEYTLPKLSWKKFFPSLLRVLCYVFLYSSGLYIWTRMGALINIYTVFVPPASQSHRSSENMSFSMSSVLFFGVIKHIYNYNKLKESAQQLRIEKQQAELNYLKSQTNPHFLFNTLNNIYSLARDKSDLAPESIMRLSKMLRYMLYETGGPYIAIEQELKIISDYIALEKLRYDDTLRINFNHDIEDMKQALPPLLLIPLVENAFKHGVSETRSQPFVDIHLSVNKRQLAFVVKNSTEEFFGEAGVKENIGLSNLRRQLELLYTGYSLVVEQGKNTFTSTLKINLASHV